MTANLIPLVSVHMITYNHENFIRDAIDGVLMQQTDFDFELIISNDCSTDNTYSIVREYINIHPKNDCIKYFQHENNVGMMANFIFTLKKCTGKYIAVCEGDDYWTDPQKLQKQVSALEANPAYSMVISNRKILKEDNKLHNEYYDETYHKEIFTITDVVNGFVPGMQTILFRNYLTLPDYFMAHPEFYYGDRYLTYYCSLFGNILLIKDITALYRMTGSGVWSINTPLQKLQAYAKFMEDFHKSLGIPKNNETLARLAFDASYTILRYCVKRPKFFTNKIYRNMITKPWHTYKKMNRIKLFFSVLLNRRKISDSRIKNNIQY